MIDKADAHVAVEQDDANIQQVQRVGQGVQDGFGGLGNRESRHATVLYPWMVRQPISALIGRGYRGMLESNS